MAKLLPLPLARLVSRAFAELERQKSIFDLPARKFFVADPQFDTSIDVHKHRVSTPLGPSSGPHTQMAQNIVLCWLAGARVIELKTVQILDSLRIPRPCIDARTVGFNVEWSQELSIEQSLQEYVKASMLIDILAPKLGFDRPLFDVSVGYDLDGIRSDRITRFLRGMRDARKTIDALREHRFRDVEFTTRIADTITVSTFHGCPANQVERIADYLMSVLQFDCTIKLNPTLLGPRRVNEILHDRLGFFDIEVPISAFDGDLTLTEACTMIDRLGRRARKIGRSFGVKLTNTLVVENSSEFLPQSEKLAYLSGAPLHVLAMHLVSRFRRAFGDAVPISFSAGIDRTNYPDAVNLGLTPVTVCTDLLKQGGYGRLHAYAKELHDRMEAVGAHSIDEFIRRGRPVTLAEAKALNTDEYVASLDSDPRYHRRKVERTRRKHGQALEFFDCATCDLCIPACPNDAIFKIPSLGMGKKSHQIACFAELCNDCGNCEVFCPDNGAPNELKFRLFIDEDAWRRDARGGFLIGGPPQHALHDYVERAVLDTSRINYINCGETK